MNHSIVPQLEGQTVVALSESEINLILDGLCGALGAEEQTLVDLIRRLALATRSGAVTTAQELQGFFVR